MLSRSGTEKSPDTASTHCCPKVRLLNQPSHKGTRPCSSTESPNMCSSAVKLNRTHPWLQARGANMLRVHTARHTLQLQSFAESLSHSRLKGHMIKEHNVVIRHTLTIQPSDAFADQMKFACRLMLYPLPNHAQQRQRKTQCSRRARWQVSMKPMKCSSRIWSASVWWQRLKTTSH